MRDKAQKPGRLKSALLSWFPWFSSRWTISSGSPPSRDSDSGQVVNEATALRLSTVYACTRLISQRIATLPLDLYRRTDDGREVAREHTLTRLLKGKPNSKMTAPVFWEAVVSSILLQRGAFIEPIRNGAKQVSSLEFLNPSRIFLDEDRDIYRYTSRKGVVREIPRKDVVYIPAFTTDGECGISVIEYGLQAIGNALAADKAASKTFKNGLHPTTYFKYPKVLKKDQRDEARTTIETLSGASKAGKPIILEAEMDVGTIGINPKDAQLLESRQASAEEICSLFGVPPTMIGRGDKASSWASSSEQLNLWFLNYTLMPWIKRIEAAIWDGLLTPVEQLTYYAEFNVEGMLRGDSAARREFYASALQNGWMNRNQVARIENKPTFTGGDVYTVQSNLIPIDKLGQESDGQQLRAALAAFLEGKT